MIKHSLRKILPFCDSELGILQGFVSEYFKDHKFGLDSEQSYILGCVGSEFHIQLRILKHRVSGQELTDFEIKNNDGWIELFEKYDNIVDYLIQKYLETIESFTDSQKYEYLFNTKFNYYLKSESEKLEFDDDYFNYFDLDKNMFNLENIYIDLSKLSTDQTKELYPHCKERLYDVQLIVDMLKNGNFLPSFKYLSLVKDNLTFCSDDEVSDKNEIGFKDFIQLFVENR